MDEEGHEAMSQTQLAISDGRQGAVSTVPVEKDQFASPGPGHAPADVVKNGEQCGGREPDRSRRPGVFVRLRIGERRQEPDVEITGRSDGCFGGGFGDDEIGRQWKMRTVLFDGTERLDQDAPLTQIRQYLRTGQVSKVSFGEHSHPLSLWVRRESRISFWSDT